MPLVRVLHGSHRRRNAEGTGTDLYVEGDTFEATDAEVRAFSDKLKPIGRPQRVPASAEPNADDGGDGGDGADDGADGDDLGEYTVADLKVLLDKLGVEYPAGAKKADLRKLAEDTIDGM